jgi:hypothetical protein
MKQRDFMRELLRQYGYDKRRVCEAYAAAERRGQVPRLRNKSKLDSEEYAKAMWDDGHRPRNPWILNYCKEHRLKVPR